MRDNETAQQQAISQDDWFWRAVGGDPLEGV
jgi:hypothetical protein